jgi:phage FluMu protein Com
MRGSGTEVIRMPAVIERHVTAGPDLQQKLEASRAGAAGEPLRTIRCPSCGFYLLDVYGHDHYYIRVKCRKCKFDETIDTALFRTMKRHRRYCHLINRKRRMRAYGKDLHLY